MNDTIFALSSGPAPAAIGVIRLSGPHVKAALASLAGGTPAPRQASLRTLRDGNGAALDQALVLWFPGPASATGEDCAELHCHGGRAVLAAVSAALSALPGLRAAAPGEFTRRAFANGRIDLAQAEALGDLLAAETELQRRVAMAGVGGALSSEVESWRREVLALAAMVEAILDFSEEDDIESLPASFHARRAALRSAIAARLDEPRGERIKEGVRVVLAGPPNAGKSSLMNALVGEGAAIVASTPGTTRDVIERPIAFSGIPFVLVDTAGLRDEDIGEIERVGIAKAEAEIARADIVLWLGAEGEGPGGAFEIQAKADDPTAPAKKHPVYVVSSKSGLGLADLVAGLCEHARSLIPLPGAAAINARQASELKVAVNALAETKDDPLILAESLRTARIAFDRLLGRSGVEDMLDALFGQFCIGK